MGKLYHTGPSPSRIKEGDRMGTPQAREKRHGGSTKKQTICMLEGGEANLSRKPLERKKVAKKREPQGRAGAKKARWVLPKITHVQTTQPKEGNETGCP